MISVIITPSAVFIHFHKTGGQFVNRLLLEYASGARRVGYHLPRSETPPDSKKLPAFGFVRNPWDWYVSWYAFNILKPERNPIFRVTSASGTLGFNRTIENLLRLGQPDSESMRAHISSDLPATREGNLGSGITARVMAGMNEPERGYLTWLWRYMFAVNERFDHVSFFRFENLRPDFKSLLVKLAIPVSSSMSAVIDAAPVVNPSPHGHYKDYFNQELRELVSAKDKEYIHAFDYMF
ncbi:MAG: hypothetical protein ACREHG_11170 [Candidatus Saccharimonadales bacterium]